MRRKIRHALYLPSFYLDLIFPDHYPIVQTLRSAPNPPCIAQPALAALVDALPEHPPQTPSAL